MPGTALRNAPAINACQVNALPESPSSIIWATPQTARPASMAANYAAIERDNALPFRYSVKQAGQKPIGHHFKGHRDAAGE